MNKDRVELKELEQAIRDEIAFEVSSYLGYDPEPYSGIDGIDDAANAVMSLLQRKGIV